MSSKNKIATQQAVGHLTKCSKYGRGHKADKPATQRPFHTLLKQQPSPTLCSPAVLGYN